MKTTIAFGVIWWIAIFIEVSVVGFTPGLAVMNEFGFTLTTLGTGIHFLLLSILSLLLAKRFQKANSKANLHPAIAAAVMITVGLILDAAITVPFFVKDYLHYFSKWTLWAGIGIYTSVFCGFLLRAKNISEDPDRRQH